MLVKFSCGCVGLVGIQGYSGNALLVSACDDSEGGVGGFYPRDMHDKTYEPLSDEDAVKVIQRMNQLVNLGQRFEELKRLLFP